jgi:preprotein translocase subunit SecG
MQVLNIFHVLIAIALIAFVLIQRGTGATAGAAFGSGASGTVFGARGAGNFLTRSTWVLAALFCTISLVMAVMVSRAMTATEPDLGVVTAVEETLIEEQVSQPEQLSVGPDEPVSTDVPAFDAMPVPEDSMDSVTEEDLPPLNDEAGNPEQDGDSG